MRLCWCVSPLNDSQNPGEPDVTTGDMSVQLEKLPVRCCGGENCNLKLPLAALLSTKADKSLELMFGLW